MFLKRILPAVLFGVVIFVLCNMDPSDLPSSSHFFEGFDKVVHFGFFFTLSFLLCRAFWTQTTFSILKILPVTFSVTICIVYGGAIELAQMLVFTYRTAEWGDFVADMLGALIGVVPFWIYKTIKEKKNETY